MLNFHKIKIEYWKVIEGDSFRESEASEVSVSLNNKKQGWR